MIFDNYIANPLLEFTLAGEQHAARINEDDSGIPEIQTVPQFSLQMVEVCLHFCTCHIEYFYI